MASFRAASSSFYMLLVLIQALSSVVTEPTISTDEGLMLLEANNICFRLSNNNTICLTDLATIAEAKAIVRAATEANRQSLIDYTDGRFESFTNSGEVDQYGKVDNTLYGGGWHLFWWFLADTPWPDVSGPGREVFGRDYGLCKKSDRYCFGRLPAVTQDDIELLVVDNHGTTYKYRFDSSNPLSTRVFAAMRLGHTTKGVCSSSVVFYPEVLSGSAPTTAQRCVKYRPEQGVTSLLVDDDGCDCKSSLSMGHGICGDSHSNSYVQTDVFGVDNLYDPGCHGPMPSNSMWLYFRKARANIAEVLSTFGGGWHRFWWFEAGQQWPCTDRAGCPGRDVLGQAWLHCDRSARYCFGRIAPGAERKDTELLAVDSNGDTYKWTFDSDACAAKTAWAAFHDHQTTPAGGCQNGEAWNPTVLRGASNNVKQDSFMYRKENGVYSLLLDDDNCDCKSTLSMGHIMCHDAHNTQYGSANTFGVDLLHDSQCNTPSTNNGLTLYFRSKKGLTFE